MRSPKKPHFDAWRIFRIISEFVDGFETMTDVGPSVSVFGSARIQPSNPYYALTEKVSEKIAAKGFAIITGGGPGVMEAANKGAQAAKGRSCGINISLPFEPKSNPFIDARYGLNFRYFFVRKVMFIRYAQAFVFMPGGFGTLDELFEALTLIQTKKIREFPIFLVGSKFWSGLVDWLKKAPHEEQMLSPDDFDRFTISDDPDQIAEAIATHANKAGMEPAFDLLTGDPFPSTTELHSWPETHPKQP